MHPFRLDLVLYGHISSLRSLKEVLKARGLGQASLAYDRFELTNWYNDFATAHKQARAMDAILQAPVYRALHGHLEIWSTNLKRSMLKMGIDTKNPKGEPMKGIWIDGRAAQAFAKLAAKYADEIIGDDDSLADHLEESMDSLQDAIQEKYGLSDLEATALRETLPGFMIVPVPVRLTKGKFFLSEASLKEAKEILE